MATEQRLIDANELVKRLNKSHEYHARNCREEVLLYRDIRIINEQPTVDAVEVVHGEWLNTKFTTELLCGNCFELTYIPITKSGRKPYNYCHNCGAKMDGDGNA